MKNIMQTRWEDLVMVNYEVDQDWVQQFVPSGCELALFGGRAFVSVVLFRFHKTKFLGIPMPFFRDFPEINLRIYVNRTENGVTKRGVVFIKELIPHKLPAFVANKLFKENFFVTPMKAEYGEKRISYEWGAGNVVKGEKVGELLDWQKGTEEEFIGNNFWAFKDLGLGAGRKGKEDRRRTCEFKITHKPWKMQRLANLELNIDFQTLYGKGWAAHINPAPTSTFYVDGSGVGVSLPNKIIKKDYKND